MGRATFTGDPTNPIAPNCEITNANCDASYAPRVPVSFAWNVTDGILGQTATSGSISTGHRTMTLYASRLLRGIEPVAIRLGF